MATKSSVVAPNPWGDPRAKMTAFGAKSAPQKAVSPPKTPGSAKVRQHYAMATKGK